MRRLFMMCTKEREVCRYELRDTGKSNKQHSKQKSFEWERQKMRFQDCYCGSQHSTAEGILTPETIEYKWHRSRFVSTTQKTATLPETNRRDSPTNTSSAVPAHRTTGHRTT